MAGQLIPPRDFAIHVPSGRYAPERCIAMWVDLMNACEQFLLAGLRREIGPEGDLRAAYRQWYAQQMEEHYQTVLRMMRESERRGGGDAC